MQTAERRIELIRIMCCRRYETMSNLAFEFGVSVKTVKRDIDEITSLIPIYIKTGRYGGGVYLKESFKVSVIYMSQREISLLKKLKEQSEKVGWCRLSCEEIKMLGGIIKNYSIEN